MMDKPKVLIIGYGTVGQNLYKELEVLEPDIYDKYTRLDNRKKSYESIPDNDLALKLVYPKYDFAFICVDTPYTCDTPCDISEVVCAMNENDADIFIVKSTVLPSQVTFLRQLSTLKHIVFSPEYYGATQHCNNFDFNYTILGGAKADCTKVIQLLQNVYDGTHQFRITTPETAALVKYMENSYLAMKVSFCNQFFDIAEQVGVDYEELRELFILDPRVDASHTFVYRDRPYWDSHCLNKDVPAIAKEYDAPLLKDIITFNDIRKPKD